MKEKMLPQISLKILKVLQRESKKSKKIILEWSDVMKTIKKNVKKAEVLTGEDVYLMCCLLKDYGLVWLISRKLLWLGIISTSLNFIVVTSFCH